MSKKGAKNEKKSRSGHKKVAVSKPKPKRVKSNRRPSKKIARRKLKKTNTARKPRKTKKLAVVETAESGFWELSRKSKNRIVRSRYSTKSLLSLDGKVREIRKKQFYAKDLSDAEITKKNINFLRGQSSFVRVAYRDKKGKIKWASTPRQEIRHEDDLEGVISLLRAYADEYSNRSTNGIEGFDLEKTLKISQGTHGVRKSRRQPKKKKIKNEVQRPHPKKKSGKKKTKKLRSV